MAEPSIGMNLGGVSYWSPMHPFLNRFKSAGPWVPVGLKGETFKGSEFPADENGYPTSIIPTLSKYSIQVPFDEGAENTYVLTYKGTGTLVPAVAKTAIISNVPGKIVFKAGKPKPQILVSLTSIDPKDHVRDIVIVRQDLLDLYNSGKIFNPALLEKDTNFSGVRFMDWGRTNNSTVVTWEDRAKPSDFHWYDKGVPIEVQVAFANELQIDMWLCIPHMANDDYVRKALTLVRDTLDKSLTCNVEYSNEVWNWTFDQAHYALEQGDKLWGVDANHDGTINSLDTAEHVGTGFTQFYGYRSAQIAAIARSVSPKFKTVLATQTASNSKFKNFQTGITKANVGTLKQLFDVWAVTTYFGFRGATEAQILGWARGGEAGMAAAFAALDTDLTVSTGGFLTAQAKVAADNGLELQAYEGGLSIVPSKFPKSSVELLEFYKKLDADPRMGDLYKKMIDIFWKVGGTRLNAFADIGTPADSGLWGALYSVYQTSSPRWDALVAASAKTKLSISNEELIALYNKYKAVMKARGLPL